MNEKYAHAYIEEAEELLLQLEESLLDLESQPENSDLIGIIFRILHTLKGSGAMFGFETISSFTHEVETYFDTVRNGKSKVDKELINLILSYKDQIKKLLYLDPETETQDEENLRILEKFKNKLILDEEENEINIDNKSNKNIDFDSEEIENSMVKIDFLPTQDILLNGTDIILLFQELEEMGDFQAVVDISNLPLLEDLNPEYSYFNWEIELKTTKDDNAIRDVFIFVEDDCCLNMRRIKLNNDLLTTGEDVLFHKKEETTSLNDSEEEVKEENLLTQVEENEEKENEEPVLAKTKLSSSIKVSSDKLDTLVDLVGELVTLQSSLQQYAAAQKKSELISIVEESGRLITDLREKTMGMRMVPIGTLFNRFKRLVRDLSIDLNKNIELKLEGANTEMDKNVIDQLADPLVHLIRNCIDHGIEKPEVRLQTGKPVQGTVKLSAIHSGAYVLIKIIDDGKGLDIESIRNKGIEKGLIEADSNLPDQDIYSLIFEPGFSTAEKVTNVSGRGVGMDVVKKNIDSLKGLIQIHSKYGYGTTITLKLPLTLAIIDGLLVQIGNDHYVFPLSVIEECIELPKELRERKDDKKLLEFRGEFIPFIDLKKAFQIESSSKHNMEQIVISNLEDKRVGFIVDKVIGQHQTVIKTLGKLYRNCRGISGATILGNGKVALIVDIPQLVQLIIDNENAFLEKNLSF